jgi:hypothetical protein
MAGAAASLPPPQQPHSHVSVPLQGHATQMPSSRTHETHALKEAGQGTFVPAKKKKNLLVHHVLLSILARFLELLPRLRLHLHFFFFLGR